MAIGLGSNFALHAKLPLDDRTLFDTVADLKAYSENFLPDSCYALVKDEPTVLFVFNRQNTDDPTLGKWRRLTGGAAGNYLEKADADVLYVSKETGKALLADTDKANYDDAVTKAHEHTNASVLDKLTEDTNGDLEYNGKKIAADLSTVYSKIETDTLLVDKVDKETGKGLLDDADKANYDQAVLDDHTHSNSTVLDKLTEDTNGNLEYNGSGIGVSVDDTTASTSTVYSSQKTEDLLATKVDKEAGKDLLSDTDKANYDDAVTKAHEHTNATVLDDLSDSNGVLLYKGTIIGSGGGGSTTGYTKTETDALLATKVDKETGKALLADTDKANYDDAVTKAHEHTNASVLDKFSEDINGNPLYDGNSIGGSGASSADQVSYTNTSYPAYTDVESALGALFDEVFYVKPAISSFAMTPADTMYEIGSTVNSITFNWLVNKPITSQSLTDCTLADENVRTATYSTPLSTDKTFTLSVTDGKETATASKSIKFAWKVYYGSAADQTTYDDAFLLGLSNGDLKSNKNGTYTVDVANNEYFYIAVPKSYNDSNEIVGKIGGFDTSFDLVATFTHTNASGSSTDYNVYRSSNHSLGTTTFVI